MKLDVKMNANQLIKKIDRMIDLKHNWRPLFDVILGDVNSAIDWTLRGAILRRFTSETSPKGSPWKDLNPVYAKRKAIKWPGSTKLIASGDLFESLVSTSAKSVVQMSETKLTYGTIVPYAGYLQFGTKFMPARPMMGLSSIQKSKYKKLISQYVSQTWSKA
jgi:phage gpG-like protein